jgi:hypothetical protein
MRKTQKLMILLAILLIASFWLHLVEFDHHHHQAIFGSSETAILHSSDKKKIFTAFINFTVLASLGLLFLVASVAWNLFIFSRNVLLGVLNPIHEAISDGILQPKLCE